ncbi:MAG: methanogen output domain 1-containing protein [Methylomonas sp.]|jgi:predicted ArsR family transcriptional regulator|uniref:methanogen output domain 1-containing protein n=1 Tax=Methylomonas sp. TaxID=418 RepID=UPI0025D61137|nr:methanogen output domain 1-containing protein [Methylomonas sp.]MCK9606855.1 methanogen output domain 1-containing protein [Methylomonas sp.]
MSKNIQQAPVLLNRDDFLLQMLRHLSGTLQDVIGLQEAEGFIALVGQKIGEEINQEYRQALQLDRLNKAQVAEVLVDLKKRVHGDFYIIEETDSKIVFGNRQCPFEDKVIGREALCMMTSNVFGVIAAENLTYAKVSIDESIARGHSGCKVTLHFDPNSSAEGIEYYGSE